MTAQPLAPVIPSRDRPAARAGGRAAPVRRLPLAAAPEAPSLPDEVVYGFGRIDMPGRVGDRAIVGVLGWQPGDRVLLAVFPGEDALAAYSFAVVDQALRAHVPLARSAGGES